MWFNQSINDQYIHIGGFEWIEYLFGLEGWISQSIPSRQCTDPSIIFASFYSKTIFFNKIFCKYLWFWSQLLFTTIYVTFSYSNLSPGPGSVGHWSAVTCHFIRNITRRSLNRVIWIGISKYSQAWPLSKLILICGALWMEIVLQWCFGKNCLILSQFHLREINNLRWNKRNIPSVIEMTQREM